MENMAPSLYTQLLTVFLVTILISTVAQQIDVLVSVKGGNNVLESAPATLECEYTASNLVTGDQILSITWSIGDVPGSLITIALYYFGQPLSYPHDDFQEPGYTMTYVYGAVSGSSELAIQSVDMNDNRLYWCSVGSVYAINNAKNTQITVNVQPSSISLSSSSSSSTHANNSQSDVISGISETYTCSATGSNPSASIIWRYNDALPPGWPTDDNNTSMVTLTPGWNDHGNLLQCRATVPADNVGNFTNVNVDVKVPPTESNVILSDNREPNGYPSGTRVRVDSGNTYSFTCKVSRTRPAALIEWYLGPDNIRDNIITPTPPTEGDHLVDHSSTLMMSVTVEHHRKLLACRASIDINGAPGPINRNIELDVYGAPGDPTLSGSTDLTEAVQETFTCEAKNGYPEGQIEWYNNDVEITQTSASNTGNSNERFDISSILNLIPERKDNGHTLTCKILHEINDLQKSESINVKFCSTSIAFTETCPYNIDAGNAATLTCVSGSSNPDSSIQWYKDDSPVTSPHQPSYEDADNNGSSTTLQYATSTLNKDDNGIVLKCCATNPSINTCDLLCNTCQLNVEYPPMIQTTTIYPTYPVVEGSDVTLTCVAEGNPTPTIYWMTDEMPDTRIPTSDGILVLSNIDRSRAGYYRCGAANSKGNEKSSASLALIVHYSATITDFEDQFFVDEGQTAILNCLIIGHPVPAVTWYDRDGRIIEGERRTIEERILGSGEVNGTMLSSYLTISDVILNTDYGFYVCNGSNSIGYDSVNISVDGLAIPELPNEVRILTEKSTQTALTVQWTRGHGGGVKQWFLIHYQQLEDEDKILSGNITENNVEDYEHEIIDLSPGQAYYVTVSSGNIIGQNLGYELPDPGITKPSSPDELDITIEFNKNNDVVTVKGIPIDQDDDSCLQLQSKIDSSSEWTDILSCLNNDIADESIESNVEYVQGMYCVQDVCGSPTPGKEYTMPVGPDIGGIVGGVMGIMVALAVVVILVFFCRRKLYKNPSLEQPLKTGEIHRTDIKGDRHNVELTMVTNEGTSGNDNPVISIDSNSYANITSIQFNFPRNNLQVLRELGHGEFGRVLMAKAKGVFEEGETTTVAIKTLKDSAGVDAKNQILKEYEVMKLLTTAQEEKRNPNIIQLVGACLETDPMYVILEYMPKGDLKTLLRKGRVSKREVISNNDSAYGNLAVGCTSFTPPQLLTFARDVSNGMAFLAEQKCIHRDLAARNVLLNEHLVCKVSDFGLARDVKDVEIYQRLSECRLPLRWMAYESVVGDVHTIESDVWSFGVLLWEIVTLGGRPYPRMNGVEIRQLLKAGNRMPQPKHCSQQLYTIMSMCWEKEPKNRPTFEQLIPLLDDIIIGQMGYLSMEDLETTLYEDSSAPDANEKV